MENNKKRELQRRAAEIRKHALTAIQTANSGHIGGSFSLAEILAVLYFDQMNVDEKDPGMESRDRLVLSKGHCCPAVYAALALRGFFPLEDLAGFRRLDSYLSGHIEMTKVPGVDMSAGSLGQGLSVGAGMALSAKRFGAGNFVFVITGDGEMQEGQNWEALMAAGNFGLDNLVLIIDNNHIQLDGPTDEIMSLEPLDKKLEAFNWNVVKANGHDVEDMAKAIETAKAKNGRPTAILADTIKGGGVSVFEGQVRFHGGRPTAEEYTTAFAEINAKLAELEA